MTKRYFYLGCYIEQSSAGWWVDNSWDYESDGLAVGPFRAEREAQIHCERAA